MAFYLLQGAGLLNAAFPWSVNAVVTSNATEATVATVFDSAFRAIWLDTGLKTYIPTTVTIEETSVSTASATFKQTTKTTTSASLAGTSASVALPFHTCEIVTFRTAYATKWGRGRWYLPPLAVNALAADGFTILAAAQTDLQHGLNDYFSAVGSTYQHVILHKKATAGGGRAAFTTDVITGADIPSTFSVQRRRADKLVPSRLTVTI